MSEELDPLKHLASQVDRYRQQAEDLSVLQTGRQLIACPQCGLHEDELADLSLAVCTEDRPGIDTGLRFAPIDDESWMCPACQGLVRTQPDLPV